MTKALTKDVEVEDMAMLMIGINKATDKVKVNLSCRLRCGQVNH